MAVIAVDKCVRNLLTKRVVLREELGEALLLQAANAWLFPRAHFQLSLNKALQTSMRLTGADFGNIQLLDPESGTLKIVAHRGLRQPFLEFFNEVHSGQAMCGTAMKLRQPVFVRDVTADPIFRDNETIEVMLAAKARSERSFPLITTSGRLVGVMSSLYRAARDCTHHQMHVTKLLATNIADFIQYKLYTWV